VLEPATFWFGETRPGDHRQEPLGYHWGWSVIWTGKHSFQRLL
jgi:hypothetical protein